VFTSRPNSRDLWTSEGERIPAVFEQSAMALVREGLNRLGDEDVARQESLIRTAIASVGEGSLSRGYAPAPRKPRFAEQGDAIGLARTVGDMLCQDVLENEFCASWIGLTPVGARERSTSLQPLGLALYNGLPGCSLFLAYLAAATGDKSYERSGLPDHGRDRGARTALRHADFAGVAGADDWLGRGWLRSVAAGLLRTSSLGAGSGAACDGLTHLSPRYSLEDASLEDAFSGLATRPIWRDCQRQDDDLSSHRILTTNSRR
jgi:hypothetical protein